MSDPHRQRLQTWLQAAPFLPRTTGELVSPDGTAYCFVGGAAMVATTYPTSRIRLVGPSTQTGDAHFTVDGHPFDPDDDDTLIEAMADWYGVDLRDTTVDPVALPEPLRGELATALAAARDVHPKQWWLFGWAREGGGWPLYALSDLDVPSWLLTRLTRQVLSLDPPVVPL